MTRLLCKCKFLTVHVPHNKGFLFKDEIQLWEHLARLAQSAEHGLLISGSWVRAPRWALHFFVTCSLLKCEGFLQNVSLVQKSKLISVSVSRKCLAPKITWQKLCGLNLLTQTVRVLSSCTRVFFVLYTLKLSGLTSVSLIWHMPESRLVGDKVWSRA